MLRFVNRLLETIRDSKILRIVSSPSSFKRVVRCLFLSLLIGVGNRASAQGLPGFPQFPQLPINGQAPGSNSFPSPTPTSITPGQQRKVKMLLLTNGRIVDGVIEPNLTGYMVRKQNGHMYIPYTQVRFEANDLLDVYRKLSISMTEPTAGKHLSLAVWCVNQKLYQQAKEQIGKALLLEPDRPEARRMLVRVDAIMKSQNGAMQKKTSGNGNQELSHILTNYATSRKSLAGISMESMDLFVRKVQPITMKKCGNANCHGGKGKGKFKLEYVRVGFANSRGQTERNLASILDFIDVENPPASSFLQEPITKTRVHSSRLFLGSVGRQQYQTLQSWVQRISEERSELSHLKQKNSSEKSNHVKPASFEKASTLPPLSQPKPTGLSPSESSSPRNPLIDRVLKEEASDAFDPRDFNQKYGTSPRK